MEADRRLYDNDGKEFILRAVPVGEIDSRRTYHIHQPIYNGNPWAMIGQGRRRIDEQTVGKLREHSILNIPVRDYTGKVHLFYQDPIRNHRSKRASVYGSLVALKRRLQAS